MFKKEGEIKSVLVVFIITALSCAFLFPAPHAYCDDEDKWTGEDKALHLTVSFALDTGIYNFLKKEGNYSDTKAKITAFFTTLLIGVTKEFIDDRFSWKDIGADVLGTGIGAFVSFEF